MRTKLKLAIGLIILAIFTVNISYSQNRPEKKHATDIAPSLRIESFTFKTRGIPTKGKIYLPVSYNKDRNLPSIYLIDFTEQHFKMATDEFEKVIEGTKKIEGLEAIVVTLEQIADIDAEPDKFNEHIEIYKRLAAYVDSTYSNNTSRTLIGKGSESGIVLKALFQESSENAVFENFIATDPSGLYASAIIELIEANNLPQKKSNKKLHFSFSTSNDRDRCKFLIDRIKQAHYLWLQFESIEYTDSNYENTYPASYAAGLKYVFQER